MPIERRDILFYLHEVQSALEVYRSIKNDSSIPRDILSLSITWAWTSRDIGRGARDAAEKLRAVIDKYNPSEPVVVFFYFKKQMLGGGRDESFVIPESVVKEALITACSSQKIMIPKESQKSLFVDDLMLGLRIEKGVSGFELE